MTTPTAHVPRSGESRFVRGVTCLALAWSVVSLAVHAYWASGGTAALAGESVRGVLRAIDLAAIVLSVGAAVIALALIHPFGRRLPDWVLVVLTWIGAVAVALRGGIGVGQDILHLTNFPPIAQVADWFYLSGGILFGIAIVGFQLQRRSGRAGVIRAEGLGE